MKRRGIGNVIAAAVMVFLIVFTMSQLYTFSIDEMDNYNQVAQQVFSSNAQKQSEHLSINNVVEDITCCPTVKVTITLTNTGGATANIVAVWVDNVDVSTYPHLRVGENLFVGQGLTTTLPTIDTGISTSPPTSIPKITVKVLTALGNSVAAELLPPNQAGTTSQTLATTQLTLDPPGPITGNNMVVSLTVTNNNQLGVAFTSLTPDVCVAIGNTPPAASSCHSSTVFTGTVAAGGTSGNLPSTGTPNWSTDQWKNYLVVITSGAQAGESAVIASNNPNTLTISGNWATTPASGSAFAIRTNLCNSNSGTTAISPVSCVGPSNNVANPSNLSFLPAGGTITFDWIFYVTTIVPDTPISFEASYTNVTTSNLFASQIPTQTAIVRGAGGSSSQSGGNFQTALGSIVAYFSSFQYSQDGINWLSGSTVPGGTSTLFRLNVTNLSSKPIVLNSTTEIILTGISSLGTTPPGQLRSYTAEFYIITSCTPVDHEPPQSADATQTAACMPGGRVTAYPSTTAGRISLGPGAVITLYFGSDVVRDTLPNTTPNSGVNAIAIFSMVGNVVQGSYPPPNSPYAQASTVLMVRLS